VVNQLSNNTGGCPTLGNCLGIINGLVLYSLFIVYSQIGMENGKSSKAKAIVKCIQQIYVFSFCFEKVLIFLPILFLLCRAKKMYFLIMWELYSFFYKALSCVKYNNGSFTVYILINESDLHFKF
jgi:hypothetical protein